MLKYESIANLMVDVRNRIAPSNMSNIQDKFQDISDVHSYNTRSSASNNFYTKPSRLSVQVISFSRIGVKVSVECNTSSTKKSFQKCL